MHKEIIQKFCQQFMDDSYVTGIFQGGSSLYQELDENTDIDLFVIASDGLPRRVHGYKSQDGCLFEYFVNPISRIYRQMEEELSFCHDYWAIKIYAFSEILYDRDGEAAQLQKRARELFQMPFGENLERDLKARLIQVWENYHEFQSHLSHDLSVEPMFYETVRSMIEYICYKEQVPLLPWSKCERLLTDEIYRKNYHLKALPNEEFCSRLRRCFRSTTKEEKIDSLDQLMNLLSEKERGHMEDYCEYK